MMGHKKGKRKQRTTEQVAYRFGFVLNNVPVAVYTALIMLRLLDWLKGYGKKARWVFQHEVGETGHEHVQGYLHIRRTTATSPDRCSTLVKKMEAVTQLPIKDINIRIESNAGYGALGRYCTKDGEGKNSGTQWSDPGFRRETMQDRLEPTAEEKELKKLVEEKGLAYQKKTIKYIQHPAKDQRHTVWWWSEVGRTGKSTFVRYLNVWHKAIVIGPGKARNMAQALLSQIELIQKQGGDPAEHLRVMIIDFTRAEGGEAKGVDSEVCQFIEQVKNGSVACEKYKSQQLNLNHWLDGNPPKVIVFANREPERTAMSADRWLVGQITEQLPVEVENLAEAFDWNEGGWDGCQPSTDFKDKIDEISKAKEMEAARKKAADAVPGLEELAAGLLGEEWVPAAMMAQLEAAAAAGPAPMVWDPNGEGDKAKEKEAKEKEAKEKESKEEKKVELTTEEREALAMAANPAVAQWVKETAARKALEEAGPTGKKRLKMVLPVNEDLIDFTEDGNVLCKVCKGFKECKEMGGATCICVCFYCKHLTEECTCTGQPHVLLEDHQVPKEAQDGIGYESLEDE